VRQIKLATRQLLKVSLHDTTGCTTGLTPGCIV